MTKHNPYDHSLAAKGARAAASILADHAEESVVRISVHQFRSDILPNLANPDNHDISYWLNYVKHPNAPLHVINDDGSTLYVVPPLSQSISSTVAQFNTPSLDTKMQNLRKRVERSPRSQTQEFARTLSPAIRHSENILTNRIRLNQILVAEGYQPLLIPGVNKPLVGDVSTPAAATATQKTGYLDEFEDSNL